MTEALTKLRDILRDTIASDDQLAALASEASDARERQKESDRLVDLAREEARQEVEDAAVDRIVADQALRQRLELAAADDGPTAFDAEIRLILKEHPGMDRDTAFWELTNRMVRASVVDFINPEPLSELWTNLPGSGRYKSTTTRTHYFIPPYDQRKLMTPEFGQKRRDAYKEAEELRKKYDDVVDIPNITPREISDVRAGYRQRIGELEQIYKSDAVLLQYEGVRSQAAAELQYWSEIVRIADDVIKYRDKELSRKTKPPKWWEQAISEYDSEQEKFLARFEPKKKPEKRGLFAPDEPDFTQELKKQVFTDHLDNAFTSKEAWQTWVDGMTPTQRREYMASLQAAIDAEEAEEAERREYARIVSQAVAAGTPIGESVQRQSKVSTID